MVDVQVPNKGSRLSYSVPLIVKVLFSLSGFMAKGLIDPQQKEEGNESWTSQDAEETRQTSQEGSGSETRSPTGLFTSTSEEEEQIPNASSLEQIAQPPSALPVTPAHHRDLSHSPSPPLLASPLLSSQRPSCLPSSYPLPLASAIPSPQSSHSSSPANSPSPFLPFRNASVSVEELQERAMQDSQNNNVDENSNDQQMDQYVNYNQSQFAADPSVRPRTRRRQGSDETDRVPLPESRPRRRGSGGNFTHRRNLSDGQTYSCLRAREPNYSQLRALSSPHGKCIVSSKLSLQFVVECFNTPKS